MFSRLGPGQVPERGQLVKMPTAISTAKVATRKIKGLFLRRPAVLSWVESLMSFSPFWSTSRRSDGLLCIEGDRGLRVSSRSIAFNIFYKLRIIVNNKLIKLRNFINYYLITLVKV